MRAVLSGLPLAIAAGLDYWIGDPWNWIHPVQVMGWGIQVYSQAVLRTFTTPGRLRGAGIVLTLGLLSLSASLGGGLVWGAMQIHSLMGGAIAAILLASCFAGRSLRAAADDVLEAIAAGDLPEARTRLSRYVGRDTTELDEPDILRAILETVTENATDGVMAPLFYALVGTLGAVALGLDGAIAAVSLSLAYKAASTLDSMVGYREAPYTHIGWFSARSEDVLTWLPCRLVVFTLGLLSGRPMQVWRICRRDAPQDPSPNAGWSECAYAAVLGVQLGGSNVYRGVVKAKPLLGDRQHPITPDRIYAALMLTRWMFLLWLGLGAIGLLSYAWLQSSGLI